MHALNIVLKQLWCCFLLKVVDVFHVYSIKNILRVKVLFESSILSILMCD
jgi:hypothetical protein